MPREIKASVAAAVTMITSQLQPKPSNNLAGPIERKADKRGVSLIGGR